MQAVIKIIQENIPEVRLGVWGLLKLLTRNISNSNTDALANTTDYYLLKCIQLGNVGDKVALISFTFTMMF